MSPRLVLATSNAAKLREITKMFDGGWELVPQGDLAVEPVDEPHATFIENALAKARHAAASTGLPALADDSGLCVDALGGAPGVLSARFAGERTDEHRNNAELLRRLAGVTQRDAHYICVLVALRTADDAEPLIVDARWHGKIANGPSGERGFGYDPLFYVPEVDATAAELEPEHKNQISHRGLAFKALATALSIWHL